MEIPRIINDQQWIIHRGLHEGGASSVSFPLSRQKSLSLSSSPSQSQLSPKEEDIQGRKFRPFRNQLWNEWTTLLRECQASVYGRCGWGLFRKKELNFGLFINPSSFCFKVFGMLPTRKHAGPGLCVPRLTQVIRSLGLRTEGHVQLRPCISMLALNLEYLSTFTLLTRDHCPQLGMPCLLPHRPWNPHSRSSLLVAVHDFYGNISWK